MKKLIIILFFAPLISNAQLANDKAAHLAFGSFFGVAGNGIVWELTGNKNLALGGGVLLGTGIGVTKELYDRNKTGFSTPDIMYTIVGSVIGSLSIRIAINKGISKKNIPVNDRWKIDEQLVKL